MTSFRESDFSSIDMFRVWATQVLGNARRPTTLLFAVIYLQCNFLLKSSIEALQLIVLRIAWHLLAMNRTAELDADIIKF
jgi:hypothetical protein